MKRRLPDQDQARTDKIAAMQVKITEGLNSGISPLSFDQIMEKARRRADELNLTRP